MNRTYLDSGDLRVELLGRGVAWLDTGTHQSLLQAQTFVEAIQERQGLEVACIEEIAFRQGWINADELEALTKEWAEKLAQGPSMGLAVTKRMLNEEASMTLAEAMQAEAEVQAECMTHPDFQEAYEAFTQKRPKEFTKHKRDGSEA